MHDVPQVDDVTHRGLQAEVRTSGDHVVVALNDEIDISNADLLPATVAAAVDGDKAVLIDLSGVTFLDSSGLRAILVCEDSLAHEGISVKVVNPSDQSRRIFEICGLTHLLA
jgi:anti-anti-sigma factor